MDTSLIDPNNHAPAVMADDVWGDHGGLGQGPRGATLVLPAKKARAKTAAATGRATEGLRLGAESPRRSAEGADTQLEVRAIDGGVVRLAPEVSSAAKVPRLPVYQERPAGNDVKRPAQSEDHEWGRARTHSVRWILGTSLGVASVVVIALVLLPLINESNAEHPRAGQSGMVVDPEEKIEDTVAVNDLLNRQPEAEQLFRAFASASTAEEILPLVRDVASVERLIRDHHRPGVISKEWLPSDQTLWNINTDGGRPFGLLEGSLPNFAKFSAYCVLDDHQLHLDWKATTGYGTATFDELAHNQGAPDEIRARIIASDFYTAAYPETECQCYQLASPDESQVIWCYTRRGEPVDEVLGALFRGGDILGSSAEQKKVTVRLAHGPAGSLPNQWMIAELLHKEWITP
jgi:hypothetical protein